MPHLEPLKKGTPQPKVKRLRPAQPGTGTRKLKLATRDPRKGRGRGRGR